METTVTVGIITMNLSVDSRFIHTSLSVIASRWRIPYVASQNKPTHCAYCSYFATLFEMRLN